MTFDFSGIQNLKNIETKKDPANKNSRSATNSKAWASGTGYGSEIAGSTQAWDIKAWEKKEKKKVREMFFTHFFPVSFSHFVILSEDFSTPTFIIES